MNKFYKYKLEVKGDANVEYFSDYDGYEFLAFNDEDALLKAERIQKTCEEKMLADGVELTPDDPCLVNHVFRVTGDEYLKVDYCLEHDTTMKKVFNKLSTDIQNEVKEALKAFDECHVIFEDGEYKVTCCISLKDKYANDYRFVATFHKNDVFTVEEQIINYVESFHDYPIEYDGERDYAMLKRMTWNDHVKFKNGNIILVDKHANDFDLTKLCPSVKPNSRIYNFEEEEIDLDYGDGRIEVDGDLYYQLSLMIDEDEEEYEFIGYVSSTDLIALYRITPLHSEKKITQEKRSIKR